MSAPLGRRGPAGVARHAGGLCWGRKWVGGWSMHTPRQAKSPENTPLREAPPDGAKYSMLATTLRVRLDHFHAYHSSKVWSAASKAH